MYSKMIVVSLFLAAPVWGDRESCQKAVSEFEALDQTWCKKACYKDENDATAVGGGLSKCPDDVDERQPSSCATEACHNAYANINWDEMRNGFESCATVSGMEAYAGYMGFVQMFRMSLVGGCRIQDETVYGPAGSNDSRCANAFQTFMHLMSHETCPKSCTSDATEKFNHPELKMCGEDEDDRAGGSCDVSSCHEAYAAMDWNALTADLERCADADNEHLRGLVVYTGHAAGSRMHLMHSCRITDDELSNSNDPDVMCGAAYLKLARFYGPDAACQKACSNDDEEVAEGRYEACGEDEEEYTSASCDNAACHRAYAEMDWDDLEVGLATCARAQGEHYQGIAEHFSSETAHYARLTFVSQCGVTDPKFANYDPECTERECEPIIVACPALAAASETERWGVDTDYVLGHAEDADACVKDGIVACCQKCTSLELVWPANSNNAICRSVMSRSEYDSAYPADSGDNEGDNVDNEGDSGDNEGDDDDGDDDDGDDSASTAGSSTMIMIFGAGTIAMSGGFV